MRTANDPDQVDVESQNTQASNGKANNASLYKI